MEALISVVVPVYNVERYLDRCIQSIVRQSYQNLQILLVDDGSTDSSAAICDAWAEKDNRICVIHKENAGLGMARNTGIEHAVGKYICFVDSDDYIEKQILEKVCRISEEEHSELTIFGMTLVDGNGTADMNCITATKTVFRGHEVQTELLPDVINSSSKDAIVRNLSLSACVCLLSMSLIHRCGWRFVSEREIISEDSYSLLQLYKHVDCAVVLPENGYFYCRNRASLTQRYREDRYDKTSAFYIRALELCQMSGYNAKVAERLDRLFFAFVLSILKQIAGSDLKGKEKLRRTKDIVCDALMQNILHRLTTRCYSLKIQMIFLAMRFRMHRLVYLMAKLQTKYDKKKISA